MSRTQREWLEYAIQAGIDLLDQIDAATADLEDDEREIYCSDEVAA
jgi:hypothetical protein